MTTITVGEILTEEELKQALKIMEQPDYHMPLTAYLESIEPKLEDKGMLPAFFAYWLELAQMEGKI